MENKTNNKKISLNSQYEINTTANTSNTNLTYPLNTSGNGLYFDSGMDTTGPVETTVKRKFHIKIDLDREDVEEVVFQYKGKTITLKQNEFDKLKTLIEI